MQNVKVERIIIIFLFFIIVCESFGLYYFYSKAGQDDGISEETEILKSIEKEEDSLAEPARIYVDVKGAVNSPGVYEVNENSIINDVIALAGGLKSNSYTNNINLSKKLNDEMVIYVYTKYEYNNLKKTNTNESCKIINKYEISECLNNGISIIEPNSPSLEKDNDAAQDIKNDEVETPKVNINTASKEELMNISGIGESKAEGIIKYREAHGPFSKIEDIQNVSGIGTAMYEKIKNYITV